MMNSFRARHVWLLGSAISLALSGAAHAQSSASYADMRTWELDGVSGGVWRDPANLNTVFTSAISGRSVIQTFNNATGSMFLLSNDTNVINRTIWGTLQVKSRHTDPLGNCSPSCATLETDNDFLGFAVGYKNEVGNNAFPESYLGFTWNRRLEAGNPSPATSPYTLPTNLPGGGAAQEGLWLIRAAPPDGEGDPIGAGATVLDSDTGANTGWSLDHEYKFRIVYTTTRIRVYIDDVLRLDATTPANSPFPAGQFGFTNASQANVLFGNVREADASVFDTAPVAADDQYFYGLTWGAGYDNTNTFDTATAVVAGKPQPSGILDNDYDPDGDVFKLRVNTVDLTTPGQFEDVVGAGGGTFRVYGSGRFVYTAAPDYTTRGPYQDSFQYTIVDGDNQLSTASVTVTVQETNTQPDDIVLTDSDTNSTTDIRVDAGAAPGTIVASVATIENNALELDEYDYELAVAANGAFEIVDGMLVVRDTAALGSAGTRNIQIRSTDVEGQSTTKAFVINVDPNALPTSTNANVAANAAVPFVFGLANFPYTDADSDPLGKVLITSVPAHGTLFLDLDDDDTVDANEAIQINFNDVATRAQLVAGHLKYLSSSTIDTSTTFGFKVNDGTANSTSAYTMTVNVDADADNDGIPNTTEGTGDSDGDGTPNHLDTDSDNDGIPDSTEGTGDTDTDGVPNYRDTDSDGDGLPDGTEGGGDTDGDGIPNFRDTDADGDGLPDSTEGGGDTDGDGIPNFRDTDADGDGVPDANEGAGDSDGDGIPDYRDTDADGDGIPDAAEGNGDADGDGIPNYRDTDSDDNGVPDSVEGTADADGDGVPNYLDDSSDTDRDGIPDIVEGPLDSDGDGLPNFRDTDSDNDGVPDVLELAGLRTDTDGDAIADRFDVTQTGGADANGDGIDDAATVSDTDNDGISDVLDPDQDGDGIADFVESGAYGFDSDNDGVDDRWDANAPGASDPDGDGVANNAPPVDTDADGSVDMRDLDSDHDGIADATETDRDTDQDGVPDYLDLDSDDDSFSDVGESNGLDVDEDALLDVGGSVTSNPIDTDGDGIPNYRDVDANGNGVGDIDTTRHAALDANDDGRIDVHGTDVDGDGIADAIDGEPGQRGTRMDNDGDGVPVDRDLDDDGDGIPDSVEGDADFDGDGAIDRLDRDSDNDGIPDRIELGLPSPSGVDANGNGTDDAYESFVNRDTDDDGIPDVRDSDSDNDGIPDAVEVSLAALSGADADGDGIDDGIDVDMTHGVDANGDGVDDAKLRIVDTDGDGIADYLDADSDNDGVPDTKENGDFNNDGINDRLQKETGLKTGLKGGGGSFEMLSLLFMLALGLARAVQSASRRTAVVAGAVLIGTLPLTALQSAHANGTGCTTGESFTDGCWSVGIDAYQTKLDPDDSRSTWRVVDTSDSGYKLSVEYRFFERWSIELGYADLGAATVVNRNPSIAGREPVSYKAPSLLGGYLVFDPARRFNVQLKAGYARLETAAGFDIIDKQVNGDQLTLGAALRARIFERLELQLVHEYYDKDARQSGVGVRYAF